MRQVRIRRTARKRAVEDETADEQTCPDAPAGGVDELLALIEAALRG